MPLPDVRTSLLHMLGRTTETPPIFASRESAVGLRAARRLPALFVLSLLAAFLPAGCAFFVHADYGVGASGRVTSADGEALPGVTVTMALDEEVYVAITPVRNASAVTDENGEFCLLFLSGKRDVGFSLVFAKPGFREVVMENMSSTPGAPLSVVMSPE